MAKAVAALHTSSAKPNRRIEDGPIMGAVSFMQSKRGSNERGPPYPLDLRILDRRGCASQTPRVGRQSSCHYFADQYAGRSRENNGIVKRAHPESAGNCERFCGACGVPALDSSSPRKFSDRNSVANRPSRAHTVGRRCRSISVASTWAIVGRPESARSRSISVRSRSSTCATPSGPPPASPHR